MNNNKNNMTNENKIKLLLKRNKNSKNNNNNNSPSINRYFLLILLGLIIIGGIVLSAHIFYKKDEEPYKVGFSYSPKDVTNIDLNPPIDTTTSNINECIDECKLNETCNGITFNKNTYKCKGFKDGMLVKTNPFMYAWEKSKEKITKESQIILLTKTYQQTTVGAEKMPFPYEVYNLNFSFWLKIIDWYNSSHSLWKCVFFKSSTDNLNSKNNEIMKTSDWEDIVKLLPDQCIGVWLAPFTNNLRICITTEKNNKKTFLLPHPNKQICTSNTCLYTNDLSLKDIEGENYKEHIDLMNKYLEENKDNEIIKNEKPVNQGFTPIEPENNNKQKIMEYFDILNIPIGEAMFVSVNINKTIMEIYINNKLNYIVNLEGMPICNKFNLNIKNEPSFNGNLYNISYLPYFASFKEIQNLYKIEPKID